MGALSADKNVEPRRAPLVPVPGMEGVKKAAIAAGPFGCTISGAGPTAVAVIDDDEERGAKIGEQMVKAFLKEGNLKAMPDLLVAFPDEMRRKCSVS